MLFRFREESVHMCEGVHASVPMQALKWEKNPLVVHTGGISDGDNSAKQRDTSCSLAREGHAGRTRTQALQALCIIRAKHCPLMNVTCGGWDAAGQTSPLINWEHSSPF